MGQDDEDWVNPDWLGEQVVPNDYRLDKSTFEFLKDWAVKLTFYKDNGDRVGSGFFVDIPDSPSYDVIFTAAHNLSAIDGTPTTKLTVFANPTDPGYAVPAGDVYVCEGYKGKGPPEADYGFIRIPKTDPTARRGFGFSIKLAYEDHFPGHVYATGFQDVTPKGHPVTSTGECIECYPKVVEYTVKTEPGISGSGIWIEYNGSAVVVAIHNNGPAHPGGGSRGARLTPDLFRTVFGWLGPTVIQKGVQLRAKDIRPKKAPPTLPPQGLFLSFKTDPDFGRVRLGSGTKFNFMPAEVLLGKDLYAMEIAGGKWVACNPVNHRVTTTEVMTDRCHFSKAFGTKKPATWLKIIVKNGGKDYQLRMQGLWLKDYDEDEESPEVSFVGYPEGEKDLFNKFWFE